MSKTLDLGPITAYAIAVKNGFVGTEQEWLESLKCSSVTDEQVSSAVDAYLESHPDATVPDGSISESKLAQDVKDKFSSLSEEIANLGGGTGTGAPGQNGVGIQSVEQTTTSTEDGGTNVVTVTKTDGTSSTFQVRNGSKGSPGAGGKSAYQYAQDGGYTGTEEKFAAKLAAEMPDALPNPNALTFTGAVTGSYDGSSAVTVEIPSGGSGGGGISAFEKIGTIDLSTMAASNLGVDFTVTDVTEIVLIWTGMTNTSSSNSSMLLAFNSGDKYNTLGPRTGKAGTPTNGYTYIKVLENVGILPIVSAGATSNTNYATGGNQCTYNLIPVKEKIQKISIKQPITQYYADAGIVEVYVR